jgi:chromosome segregation ATPase
MSQESFKVALNSCNSSLDKLSQLQKEAVLKINELKLRSKTYMEQVADIDQGFNDRSASIQNSLQENIAKLTQNIGDFNRQIGQQQEDFSSAIAKLLDDLDMLIKHYQGLDNELKELEKCRKALLFVELSIRKYKAKIQSLQLMNNALFSFSQEIQEAKSAYKSNLINVSTLLTQALEDCHLKIDELEKIKAQKKRQ